MKSIYILWLLSMLALSTIQAQNIFDARQTVILQAEVQETPPQIKLSWVRDTANGGYTIWRKKILDTVWGDSLVFLAPDKTEWIDSTITPETGYEYQILKSLPAFPYGNGTPNFGSGYVYAGVKLAPKHYRGACLLLVDHRFQETLKPEILRLVHDIEMDGWQVDTQGISPNLKVDLVKNKILAWYARKPDMEHALFLLGRIPVPYSGDIAPDGHHSDHRGAWPCDGYYGTVDGLWTDEIINNTTAASSRNDNRPGDGKFDNNIFPSPVMINIGRVDLSNMDKFPESEEELLRRYLNKNHAWRTGKMPMVERGLIDNNFPVDIEGLGQTGWRNFGPMFGIQQVKDVPYRASLSQNSYLWSYGCGGGGPESASDITNTTNFATDSLQTAFTLLFGSYFGDWDYPNNFLRAAIASKTCLASAWGNRPVWFFHHMALGESIGYSTKITMNNRGLYTPRFYGGYVSTALMGDPTIRMHVSSMVENFTIDQVGPSLHLQWNGGTGDHYYIYRKYDGDSFYVLLNDEPVKNTFYTDKCVPYKKAHYMVRHAALKTSGSGSYYNLSQGVSASFQPDSTLFIVEAEISPTPSGQSGGSILIKPMGSCEPYTYQWETGETTAILLDLPAGAYCVTVSDCNLCAQTSCNVVGEISASHDPQDRFTCTLFPNPAGTFLQVNLHRQQDQPIKLLLKDTEGRTLDSKLGLGSDVFLLWDISLLPPGQYFLEVQSNFIPCTYTFIKTR